jgi:hypothetical protein
MFLAFLKSRCVSREDLVVIVLEFNLVELTLLRMILIGINTNFVSISANLFIKGHIHVGLKLLGFFAKGDSCSHLLVVVRDKNFRSGAISRHILQFTSLDTFHFRILKISFIS